MDAIHRLVADAAAVGVGVAVGWSLLLTLAGRTGGEAFVLFQAAVVTVLLVAAASGATLLVTGARPADDLHLLYAVVAIALVPLARSFLRRAAGRPSAMLLAVAFVALGAVVYRLFTTG